MHFSSSRLGMHLATADAEASIAPGLPAKQPTASGHQLGSKDRAHEAPRFNPLVDEVLDEQESGKHAPEKDLPIYFHAKVFYAKQVDPQGYMKGYETPSSVKLPGYSASMSHAALMRLAKGSDFDSEQMGALRRLSEQRFRVPSYQTRVSVFTALLSDQDSRVTPMPQNYYLSLTNQQSLGECAGISYLLSLAVAEGKHHIFLGNIYQALAAPDSTESQAFFQKLAEVQAHTESGDAYDRATLKFAPYTEIAPQLIASATSKTLLLGADGHSMTAGVIVGPQGNKTYYYNDPNYGHVEFRTAKAFKKGLDKVFTNPQVNASVRPFSGTPNNPLYAISVFNPDRIPEMSSARTGIRFMYDAPLSGLDKLKLIDPYDLPTGREFRLQLPAPATAQFNDYMPVSEGLDKLHALKGFPQFHQAVELLGEVKAFIETHPDSALGSSMSALERKLHNAINQASAPTDYPYVFEIMEQKRAKLDADKIGRPRRIQEKVLQGVSVQIGGARYVGPDKLKEIATAVDAALLKLRQRAPESAKSMGYKLTVVMANPGSQPETQLRLGKSPTLIIGDDFFAPPASGDKSVADSIAREPSIRNVEPIVRKQAALLAGKLGLYSYFKSEPKAFLTAIENRNAYTGNGHQLSQRASRSALDFMSEAFTARLYDGALDSRVDTGLKSLLHPAADKVPDTRPIDPAHVQRLQKLDETRPPIQVGEVQASRVELYKLGASIDGKPIEDASANDWDGRKLANSVLIDYSRLRENLRSAPKGAAERVSHVLGEIATNRSPASAPLIGPSDGGLESDALRAAVGQMSQQAAEMRALQRSNKPLPVDFFTSGADTSAAKSAAGLGFSAYSTFHALRSAVENLQQGNTPEAAVGLGAVAADYVGMGAEVGLSKVAQKLISNQATSILSFKVSSLGKMIEKAAGRAGLVFSVPFDTYNAVDSFNKAGRSTGKEAQDHYVNGAFAVTNAVTSIALGTAFMAGAATGPAGLIVAGTLMAAQAIYSAVRSVEDIDQYTPLSGLQKFSVGVKSFLGFEPGFGVMKPYLEAKYAKDYVKQNQARHQAFLQGKGKEYFERVVFGSADVEAKQVPGKVGLTPALWYSPATWLLSLIKVPGYVPEVAIKGGDESLMGPSKSLNGKPVHAVEGEQGENKATLWDLGDGDDWASGVEKKPNYFLLGGGKKGIRGGDADDTVVFNADARQTLEQARQVSATEKGGFSPRQTSLNGGGGRNTLTFSGPLNTAYQQGGKDITAHYFGHVINFKTNTLSIKTAESNSDGLKKIAHFQSFSNATTTPKGESFVQGNDENNLITLNGDNDVAYTGKGANIVVVNGGADIYGEGGFNTYVIHKGDLGVTITDAAESVVRLDYSTAQISGWSVSPSGDLSVNLIGETNRQLQKIVLKNAFPEEGKGDQARATFIANDGTLMSINAARQGGVFNRFPQVSRIQVDLKPLSRG